MFQMSIYKFMGVQGETKGRCVSELNERNIYKTEEQNWFKGI